MVIEAQADDISQDGSIAIKVDGKSTKYVKESDLGAVKGALKDKESEVSKLQTSLADANTKVDTEHQVVLTERAAKEQFESGAGESATLKTKVGELETQMADLTKVSGETATKLTDRLRTHLTTGYKIDETKLKDKTLADLETMEQTLILTGVQPAPAVYDGKGGGGGNGVDDLKGKSPLALATMGYEEKKK